MADTFEAVLNFHYFTPNIKLFYRIGQVEIELGQFKDDISQGDLRIEN